MSQFADYAPGMKPSLACGPFETRQAVMTDVHALAAVMAVRGGSVEQLFDQARKMIGKLDVLLIAERNGKALGWCGIQKFSIFPHAAPEWLIAGLTVTPKVRRQGIAAGLLREVVQTTPKSAPAESIFSVINARNLASIDLHLRLGFVVVARADVFAGIEFTGGEGVLLEHAGLPSS